LASIAPSTPPAVPGFRLETADGLTLAGIDYSRPDEPARERPPLFLLHGGMAHARWFDLLGPQLAHDFRPFAIDRRGHGESDWAEPDRYGWERDLDDLVHALRTIDPRPWVLAGHSQGGLLAADLAARALHPIAALVLLDVPLHPSSPRLRRTGEAFRRVPQIRWDSLEDAVRSFRPFPSPHCVPAEVLEPLARASFKPSGDGGWTSKFHWKVFQRDRTGEPSPLAGFAESIRRIDVPTLCLRGAESTILSREEHREMAARIPRGIAVEVPSTTHHLHAEAPAAVAEAILAFARTSIEAHPPAR
jgi:pimeloyl-ACP methyl ester carboxylesterase